MAGTVAASQSQGCRPRPLLQDPLHVSPPPKATRLCKVGFDETSLPSGPWVECPALPKCQRLAERSWGWRTFAFGLNGTLFREPLINRHFQLQVESRDCNGGVSEISTPCQKLGPIPSARLLRKEARQSSCSQLLPHLSQQWADSPHRRPLLSSFWPDQANILPLQDQAQLFHGCLAA